MNLPKQIPPMKATTIFFAIGMMLASPLSAADYNLGDLARAGKIEVFNRRFERTQKLPNEVLFLDAGSGDGLGWIEGIEFSEGTIELEVRGVDRPGQSFVGFAFHGRDDKTFDAVYLRPFNFKSPERSNHSIQYISMPDHDWSELRKMNPGKYESAISPAPAPDSWVTLKLVVEKKIVSAFVNGSEKPALTADLLSDGHGNKLGLWVGNGSDGWFRNLKVIPAKK